MVDPDVAHSIGLNTVTVVFHVIVEVGVTYLEVANDDVPGPVQAQTTFWSRLSIQRDKRKDMLRAYLDKARQWCPTR